MNPLRGFAPDLPTTTDGVIVDCSQFIPYESGMRAAESASSYSSALAAECLGSATLTKLDASRRVFAGTASKLYELSGTSWSDVSSGTYTLGATSRWCFTQFGDTSLASTLDETIQSTSSGSFAAISGAPQATVVESVLASGGGFVLAFNTFDGTYGTSPDRWWCCAVNDVTNWTPSVKDLCATGRLLGSEGPVTTAKKFGSDRIVAYKASSLYLGSYVGASGGVWSWEELPGFGCIGLNAVANLGTAHFVVGEDNIYIFDGSRPQPVAADCRKWFLDNSSGTYRYRTQVVFDRDNDLVRMYFPGSGSATGRPDKCLVYHLKTGQWGRDNMEVESAFIFIQPSVTFDADSGTFDSATGTFDEVPAGNKIVAVFNTSHVMQTLNADPVASSFTLHDVGDDNQVTSLVQTSLRYMQTPTSASVSAFYSMATGGSVGTGVVQSAYDVPSNGSNIFPLRQTARWHRLKFSFVGDCKVAGYSVPLKPAGRR